MSAGHAVEARCRGVDEHTIALWLFDEAPYPNVTLTDAGPWQYDLRLETGRHRPLPATMRDGTRGLVPGKFGRALHLPIGEGAGVTWPTNVRAYTGVALTLDRGDEVPERLNLGYLDWTMEFWFRAWSEQAERGVIWELRNEGPTESVAFAEGVNALLIDAGRRRFVLLSKTLAYAPWDLELEVPSDTARLNDGTWHHLAFTFCAAERQMRHYVDGRLQPLPQAGTFLPLMGQLVSMRLGRDIDGGQELYGLLDEMRLSDIVRYGADFDPPGSLSANYGQEAPHPTHANGPPLLFAPATDGPLPLGGRKHLFIDGALLETGEGVRFTPKPPTHYEITDFRCTQPWEPGPRMGPTIPDICSFWDEGERIGMLYGNDGLMGGKPTTISLAHSADGLHWTKPDLGLISWESSTHNNIVLRNACQGTAFLDLNPETPAEHRFKFVAWCMNRGFYVFTSPDGAHWRRNETVMLPFDPDGSIEVFWDDQCGVYRGYSRALLGPEHFRAIVRSQSAEILKPWPFQPADEPQWHIFAMPKPSAGELPLVDTYGEVYRFKGTKYPWAPDVYLAFPWRYVRRGNIRPGSLMLVSRDGEQWTPYEPPYYFSSGWELGGRIVLEALMEQGMVRRGDEIWQYGTVRFTEHGGALYRGVEHEGGYFDRLLRLTQRLDGFVALEAGRDGGWCTTRPLLFEGRSLQLNVAAQGSVRVGILDAEGRPLPGLDVASCRPIHGDAVAHTVWWDTDADLAAWAGRPLRLRFELQDASLYAFQFVPLLA